MLTESRDVESREDKTMHDREAKTDARKERKREPVPSSIPSFLDQSERKTEIYICEDNSILLKNKWHSFLLFLTRHVLAQPRFII